MITASTIIACIVTLLISLVLPVVVLILYAVKNKNQGIVAAWLLGAAGFFVTQIIIRLPILTLLQGQSWFSAFAQNNLFLYTFCLAFSAGIFELAGRFVVAKAMEKKMTWKKSFAAGLGHGGIEAIFLIGMTYINNLLYIIMINSGTFDTLIGQAAEAGIDVSQLEMIRTQLISMPPAMFLLAGYERILAVICHIGMSVLICYGVAHKKTGICIMLCLGIHTLMDMTTGITLILPQNTAYLLIYIILTVLAVGSVLLIRFLKRRWDGYVD